MSAGSGNQTSALVQGQDLKSNSLPLSHFVGLLFVLKEYLYPLFLASDIDFHSVDIDVA